MKEQGEVKSSFINCWTHSYEENSGEGEDVYRLCDFKEFPASRFRAVYDLKENGTCRYYVLAPNDAHYYASGNWTYDQENSLLKINNEEGEMVAELKVIEIIEDKKLILKP